MHLLHLLQAVQSIFQKKILDIKRKHKLHETRMRDIDDV